MNNFTKKYVITYVYFERLSFQSSQFFSSKRAGPAARLFGKYSNFTNLRYVYSLKRSQMASLSLCVRAFDRRSSFNSFRTFSKVTISNTCFQRKSTIEKSQTHVVLNEKQYKILYLGCWIQIQCIEVHTRYTWRTSNRL